MMLSYKDPSTTIEKSGTLLAVLPVGSTEQHGSHLPLCTDTVIASKVAEHVAKRIGAFLLPCLPYSCSLEHRGFKGTIWLRSSTVAAVIRDISESLELSGFRFLAIVNGHGGNYILRPVVRELNAQPKGLKIILADIYSLASSLCKPSDLHAGEVETSLMLYLKPGLVGRAMQDYVPAAPRADIDYLGFKGLTETGVWGWPSKASREKGERFFRTMVSETCKYILEKIKMFNNNFQAK